MRVRFIEQALALQIAHLDEIAINDSQSSYARPRQQICLGRAQGTTANNDDLR